MAALEVTVQPRDATYARRPTVGVVTVTYNSDCFFDTYMESLARQTPPPSRSTLRDDCETV